MQRFCQHTIGALDSCKMADINVEEFENVSRESDHRSRESQDSSSRYKVNSKFLHNSKNYAALVLLILSLQHLSCTTSRHCTFFVSI